MQIGIQQFLAYGKDLFHLTPTLVAKQVIKQEDQVISIAILGGHGVGDVTDIDIKQHRCKR